MANMTANAPGTVVNCDTCGDRVDPYFHCCPWAQNDRPLGTDPVDDSLRTDEERDRLKNWIEGHSDPAK